MTARPPLSAGPPHRRGRARLVLHFLALALMGGGVVVAVIGIRYGLDHDSRENIVSALLMGGGMEALSILLLYLNSRMAGREGRKGDGGPPAAFPPRADKEIAQDLGLDFDLD